MLEVTEVSIQSGSMSFLTSAAIITRTAIGSIVLNRCNAL